MAGVPIRFGVSDGANIRKLSIYKYDCILLINFQILRKIDFSSRTFAIYSRALLANSESFSRITCLSNTLNNGFFISPAVSNVYRT